MSFNLGFYKLYTRHGLAIFFNQLFTSLFWTLSSLSPFPTFVSLPLRSTRSDEKLISFREKFPVWWFLLFKLKKVFNKIWYLYRLRRFITINNKETNEPPPLFSPCLILVITGSLIWERVEYGGGRWVHDGDTGVLWNPYKGPY